MSLPDLHAPDPMGAAAHEASQFAHLFQYRLLAAASPTLDRAKRASELQRAFEQWPKLCRAMAKLQEVAPNASRQAEEADARMRDFIENRELLARQRGEA